MRREPVITVGSLAIITETAAAVALQNEIGQGPCLDALTWGAPIRIPATRDEGRWPLFSGPAAIALAGNEALRPLQEALSTRNMIGQATGIIMERFGMTPDTAFAVLARVSQHTTLKLRDVAEELWCTGALPRAGRIRQPASGEAPGRRRTVS